MMRRGSLFLVLTCTAVSALFVGGCKSEDDYKRERIEKASQQFQKAKQRELAKDTVLTLEQCLRLAREQNIARRVEELEKDASKNMMLAELFGMLPDLTISNDFTTRNNQPGSRSEGLQDDGGTYSYSTSSDRTVNKLNIDLAFSLLDFGLAYFNTLQSSDRILAKAKQIERMEQNLELEVIKAYYKVAATQRSMDVVGNLMSKSSRYIALINDREKVKTLKLLPRDVLKERERILGIQQRLDNYTRVHEEACITLRNLLGLYPTSDVEVDSSVLDKVPNFDRPEITLMEQIAVLHRPELYEIDIQRHINILECRKTILMMLPNVQFYMDFINNNNSFLYSQSWWEMAVRAAYNALKTPQYVYRYMAYSDQADAEAVRAYSQAIAVLTQVRIANIDIDMWAERYKQSSEEFKTANTYAADLEKMLGKSGSVKPQDVVRARQEAALHELDKIATLSSYNVAYYRLLNAVGVSKLDQQIISTAKQELAQAEKEFSKELEASRTAYSEKLATQEESRITKLLFEDGKKFYEKNENVRAALYFQRAAERGSADAAFCLGKLYLTGTGVEQNHQLALKYLNQAASLGKQEAMQVCGWFYYRGSMNIERNPEKSEEYYQSAAKSGDARSYYWLGVVRHEKQDYAGAFSAFREAARRGDVASMTWIGSYYWEGKAEVKDPEKDRYSEAIRWFRRAAYKRDTVSMYNLYVLNSFLAEKLNDILTQFPEDFHQGEPESRVLVEKIWNLSPAIKTAPLAGKTLRSELKEKMLKVMAEKAETGPGKAMRQTALKNVEKDLQNAKKTTMDEATRWKKEFDQLQKVQ